jgi:hypothetical protein
MSDALEMRQNGSVCGCEIARDNVVWNQVNVVCVTRLYVRSGGGFRFHCGPG